LAVVSVVLLVLEKSIEIDSVGLSVGDVGSAVVGKGDGLGVGDGEGISVGICEGDVDGK